MYVHHVNAYCPRKSEEKNGCPETRVPNVCESTCVCREQNTGPLQEQSVLLQSVLSHLSSLRDSFEELNNPAIMVLSIYPKQLENYVHMNHCVYIYLAPAFVIAKSWEQTRL